MTLKLNGSTSGSVSIDAPASTTGGADVAFKFPVADGSAGQVLQTDGSGNLSWVDPYNITYGSTTSLGTNAYYDWTGLVSTNVKKYEVIIQGLSWGSAENPNFKIGDSGGLENSGYTVSAGYLSNASYAGTDFRTGGWHFRSLESASIVYDMKFTLTKFDGNKWYGEGWAQKTGDSDGTLYWVRGFKELSGALTTISLSSFNAAVIDGGTQRLLTYT